MRTHSRGLTLPELLVVIAVIALVISAIFAITLQSSRTYARTATHLSPQSALPLAMKRMERIMCEAMFIRVGSSSTAIELVLPLKDSARFIQTQSVEIDPITHAKTLKRMEGKHVCFFLGRIGTTSPVQAIPDALYGDTIFMISSGSDTTKGTDIINTDGTLSASYSNAKMIIAGIASVPTIPDPANPGQSKATTIFNYAASSTATPSQQAMGAQIVRITLTMPIVDGPTAGEPIKDHTLSTEFYLRNFEAL